MLVQLVKEDLLRSERRRRVRVGDVVGRSRACECTRRLWEAGDLSGEDTVGVDVGVGGAATDGTRLLLTTPAVLRAGGAGDGRRAAHADLAGTDSGCSRCEARVVARKDVREVGIAWGREELAGLEGVEEGGYDVDTETHGDDDGEMTLRGWALCEFLRSGLRSLMGFGADGRRLEDMKRKKIILRV